MKPDQERVRGLLTDTVTLLCRNGLQYSKELRVQGLLGITLDNDDVFVVHINEVFDELVAGKVAGLVSAEMDNAAAGSDTTSEPTERSESVSKSRKGVPQKHGIQRTSSPMLQGSSKRKATFRNMSPLMRVKKEEVDDDLVIVDSKGNDGATDLIPGMSELSSDGDREAMRMSYGGANDDGGEGPPSAKRRADHSKAAESFTETNTASGTPFITGMMRNSTENDTDHGTADDLGNASLDGSQLSNIGPLQDGQVLFDGSGQGCSAWDETQKQNNLQDQNAVSQDSIYSGPASDRDIFQDDEQNEYLESYQLRVPNDDADQENIPHDYPLFNANSSGTFDANFIKPMTYCMGERDYSVWPENLVIADFGKTNMKYKVILFPGPLLFRSGLLRYGRGLTMEIINRIYVELEEEGFGVKMPTKDNIFIKFLPESFNVDPEDVKHAKLRDAVPYAMYHKKFYMSHTHLRQIKTVSVLLTKLESFMGSEYTETVRSYFGKEWDLLK